MSNARANQAAGSAGGKSASKAVPNLIAYDAFLDKLGKKDREGIMRQVASYEEAGKGEYAKLWKRLACLLSTLAPHMPQVSGRKAVRFFLADGKHRLQVFALEDLNGDGLAVYAGDIIAQATKAGILKGAEKGDPDQHRLPGAGGQTLTIESLTAEGTATAPEYYRHMLGWNRRAVRIVVPMDATVAQVDAAEALCVLVSEQVAKA